MNGLIGVVTRSRVEASSLQLTCRLQRRAAGLSSATRFGGLVVSLLLVSPACAQADADPSASTEPPAPSSVDAPPVESSLQDLPTTGDDTPGKPQLQDLPAPDEDLVRFTVILENDKFVGTDRFYTNGFKLALQSTDLGPVSRTISSLLSAIPILDARPLDWGLTVGHEIYTPEDVSEPLLIPSDRPYGAWLYGGVSLTRGNRPRPEEAAPPVLFEDQIVLQLGALGKSGLGEEVQNTWHRDVINVEESEGWDNQLRSEVGVQLYYRRTFMFQAVGTPDGLGGDLLPHLGVALGNVFTHAALGVTARLGWNVGRGFGPPQRIASAGLDAVAKQEGLSLYAFAHLEGRFVLWNAFIDGTLVRDSPARPSVNGVVEPVDVTRETFVADIDVGIMLAWGPLALTFTATRRTREFEEQRDSFSFGVIHLQLTF